MESRKCHCGNNRFVAHQVTRHDVLVNADGDYLEDRGVYDAESPYGPFTCTQCSTEYDDLSELNQKQGSENDSRCQTIFDIIGSACALAGFKIIDGNRNSVIIRSAASDTDYEITVTELPG